MTHPTTPNAIDSGPDGSGSLQLDDDRKARLLRMAANLRNDLMRQDGLGPTLRAECLARVERWISEAGAI